jgi:segregation and condensation protein A
VFEGPLDLLLYLIRRQQIDVYDIPVARIARQFLDYMGLMQQWDIELASDFLVMAATLLEIKSRMLLPKPPPELVESDETDEDPRAELVRRLLEYQRYKAAAGDLQIRAEAEKRIMGRTTVVPGLTFQRPDPDLAGDPDAFSLWTALQSLLARAEVQEPSVREVHRAKVTIRQQMVRILRILDAAPQGVGFLAIFLDDQGHIPTRLEVIVTFLAMLELMRLRRIQVVQEELFGEISIKAMQVGFALRDDA